MVKKYIVSLTEAEQKELRTLISRRNEKAGVVKRAYILLAADKYSESLPDSEISKRYKVTIRCI